ncbi:hypothetical protein HZB01_03940 [Candidatus Woesearchaeota archaeon]|nr:hypothetical protein [Candidatus Woesearchaeota archaeon]
MPQKEVSNFSVKYTGILDEEGNVDASLMPSLSDDDIRTIYWFMNLSRVLNAKMLALQKQGRLGTFASVLGQEGGEVAVAYALKNVQNVWLAPTFRETAVLIAKGVVSY